MNNKENYNNQNTIYSLEEIMKVDNNINNNKPPKKNIIKEILSDKLFLIILIILILIMSCLIVYKAYILKNEVEKYENLIVNVKKEEKDIKVYSDSEKEEVVRKGAISNYINCLNSSIDTDNIPDNINGIITEINNFYNENENYFAYVYKDIYTGFTVSYNENQSIFAASAIKAPTDIYIYEKASTGEIDLNEKLTYTSLYHSNGSGVLKEKEFNTSYDVRTLLEYSTITSDNAAHNMMMDRYGRENMYSFWKEKGTTYIFSTNTNWGDFSAKDASIYMEELYNFYVNNDEYGKEVMNNFLKSYPKFITNDEASDIASKSGWSGSSLHDAAIIFVDNPYIVIALSNMGATDNYQEYFDKVSELSYKLHTEYWKYKIDSCENIKMY